MWKNNNNNKETQDSCLQNFTFIWRLYFYIQHSRFVKMFLKITAKFNTTHCVLSFFEKFPFIL